jgi:hypothetical protein
MTLTAQILLVGTFISICSFAQGAHMFTGNETMSQIVDKFKATQNNLYGQQVTVYTTSGAYEGKLAEKGSSFLILEKDTGRTTVDGNKSQKVFEQKLIMLSSIIGFEYKELR